MKPLISWMFKYLERIQHLKQTCTVKTRVGIRTYMQNHATGMFIPFGQAIWLRRIISDDTVLDEHLKKLETWFTNCGYN